jgi:hypothetical protein
MSIVAASIALQWRVAWTVSRTAVTGVVLVAGMVALQLWAINIGYPLRVTSDAPTFLALLQGMAGHPLGAQSPFLGTRGIASPHATPYMLGLALLWKAIAPAGTAADPIAAGRFLGFVGIFVSIATLGTVAAYAWRSAGRRAGLLSVPVLLVLFGPAHVIWATDLSINGLLDAGFYPQNVAIALTLGAVLAIGRTGWASLALAIGLTGATMVVHPLTGTLLCGLAAAEGCRRAVRAEAGVYRPRRRNVRAEAGVYRPSAALVLGFVAGMAWPAYSLNGAMSQSGIPGWAIVAACAAAPAVATALASRRSRLAEVRRGLHRVADALSGHRAETWLAIAGAALVGGLAVWQVVLLAQPATDPLIHTNRLALYWGEDRWRWFAMFGAGAVGLTGLVRLARRGRPLPLIWFGGCYGIAALGLLGLPVPVWWRFLLLCQIPLAIGTASVLVETTHARTRWIVGGTLAGALIFKLVTLVALPTRITYFGSPLQETYSLNRVIPHDPPGLVASDPFTSFYVPAATGRRVLTVTKAHVGSPAELNASTRGYARLHAFYAAPDANWWPTAQALWNAGVRYVLVDKMTSLAPPTLERFSTGPTPLVRTTSDARTMGRMHWRLQRVGALVHNGPTYVLYRLREQTLFPGRRSNGRSGT